MLIGQRTSEARWLHGCQAAFTIVCLQATPEHTMRPCLETCGLFVFHFHDGQVHRLQWTVHRCIFGAIWLQVMAISIDGTKRHFLNSMPGRPFVI